MAGRSQIGSYARCADIDVALAAGVPLKTIAGRHPFSRFAIGRHKARLCAEQREYWKSLRRLCAERGINRHSFGGMTS